MTSTPIDCVPLAKFGNMTSGNGLVSLFDGATGVNGAWAPGTSGWAGVTLDAPKKIAGASITSRAPNGFDSSGNAYSVLLRLYAKQGVVPASLTDGQILASSSFTDPNSVTSVALMSNDAVTEFDHVWAAVIAGGGLATASEISLLENDETEPEPAPLPSIANPTVTLFGNNNSIDPPTHLPITAGSSSNYIYNVVQSAKLTNIKAGDIVHATGEFQVTTSYAYNVMISSYMVVAASATEALVGQAVCKAEGENFDLNVHHKRDTRVGWWVADQDYEEIYLNLVLWSASTVASSGHKLKIDTAKLVALHFGSSA